MPANESTRSASPLQADPQLSAYFTSEDERRERTRAMFNGAAGAYDHAEGLTALGTGSWYRRYALARAGLGEGMRVLDVAAGTGLVSREACRLIGSPGLLTALDPSPGMLAELRKKLEVETLEAYAEAIPMEDDQVDFLSMGYALRHVSDLGQVFREYLRVLRPQGSACIMEITRPRSALGMALMKGYIRGVVPLLSRLTRRGPEVGLLWEYYWDTIQASVSPDEVMNAMRAAGFTDVRCHVTLGVFREYLGRKPARPA
jgi:demethylmenaquinone methyltransferase / 2-methoxy-6-polyprenyl-1,4-benzoquinol methylase